MKTLGNLRVTDPSCCVRKKKKNKKKKKEKTPKNKTSCRDTDKRQAFGRSRHTDKHLGEVCKNFSQIHLEVFYRTTPDREKKVSLAWRILNKRCMPY